MRGRRARLAMAIAAIAGSGIACALPPGEEPLSLLEVPYVVHSGGAEREVSSPVSLGGEARECLAVATPAEARFRVRVPPRGVLTFAIGVESPTAASGTGDGGGRIRFVVRAGRDSPRRPIFDREVHVARSDQWLDQRVDLRRFAGEEIWLSFASESSGPGGFHGLFADPVLHDRARYRQGRGVLLVSIDTLRRDHVSLYGYRRKTTPRLEALAEESVVFEDAVSTSSWTLPAHASLLSSLHGSVHGAVDLEKRLPEDLPALPRWLRENGFFTQAMVTHLYLSREYGFDQGFDRHLYLPETRARELTDRAISFLHARGDRDFFLFLHYYDPHWHYDPPPPYDRAFDPGYEGSANGIWWRFKEKTRDTIDPRDLQHILALYDGEILYTDHHLGRLLREMKRLELFDKTLVVVTSDHGEEFLEHGGWEHQKTLYEEQLRIPLLIKLPGGAHAARRVGGQVSLVDVAPTVLDLLGIAAAEKLQGRSLLPRIRRDDPAASSPAAWAETEHTIDGSHKLALRRGASGAKLIFSLWPGREPGVELYDLANDPEETENLSSRSVEVLRKAGAQLEAFFEDAQRRRDGLGSAPPVELTPEQFDKLRALGYVR